MLLIKFKLFTHVISALKASEESNIACNHIFLGVGSWGSQEGFSESWTTLLSVFLVFGNNLNCQNKSGAHQTLKPISQYLCCTGSSGVAADILPTLRIFYVDFIALHLPFTEIIMLTCKGECQKNLISTKSICSISCNMNPQTMNQNLVSLPKFISISCYRSQSFFILPIFGKLCWIVTGAKISSFNKEIATKWDSVKIICKTKYLRLCRQNWDIFVNSSSCFKYFWFYPEINSVCEG